MHVAHRVAQPFTGGVASRRYRKALRIGVSLSVVAAVSLLTLDLRGSAAPSPFAADPLLDQQWHLKDRGKETGGANVQAAWPSSVGAGVVIGIVDDGVLYTHPDLSPNYLASASYDFNFSDADPQPFSTAGHGTSVAGVAAARGDNSIGVSGVAPQASIAGLRLTALVATDAQEAAAFNFQPSVIHILNNSWNPTDNGTTLKGPGTQAVAARQSAITSGRSGKGRIFVWSSGNGRLSGDDCNFDGYANHRFAIAVGASTDSAVQMPQSEGCSALMVLAPAGGGSRALTTTDLIGSPGYDSGDYTSAFGAASTGGMSAAAPTVSGTAALMLARNPNLSWRDVQHILRRTSIRIIPTDAGWTTGQYPHNERLGFGLLDTDAAVDLAGQWASVPSEEVLSPSTRNVNMPIPDINNTGVNDTITISSNEANFVIEHVEVETTITHTWRGDLQVKLTSPSGVVSTLAPIRPNDSGDNFAAWKFGSVRHWGESAAGVWTLNVSDRRFQDTGTLNSWTLRIYGYHAATSVPGSFSKSSPANGGTGVSTSPTLSWGASSGASSYEYCYDTSNDNACSGWTSVGNSTSVGLSGLANAATYYWHVRANNAAGVTYSQGSSTAFWSFSTGAPSGAFSLSSPASGATGQSLSPVLSWTASSGATNYEYCYDTSHNGACNTSWFSIGGPSTSVTLSGLTPNTQYSWHVRALNAAGAATYAGGSATAFWAFTTIGAPGAFSHSNPGNGATGQSLTPTLSWGAASGASSYEYCYDTINDGTCAAWRSAGSNTSAALSGLSAGVTYYWQVRAINTGGTTYAEGAASSYWSFSTVPPPGAFGHSSPANGATSQALSPTLAWSASSGATSYEYCYDTSNNNACNATWISTGSATSVGLSGLTGGMTYYWQVRAINAVGTTFAEGNASSFWNFTTTAQAGGFSLLSPANNSVGQSLNPTLTWGDSTGATGYEYCYDTTNDSACSGWTSVGDTNSVGLSGLTAGVKYYWLVRAINGGGTTYANGSSTAFWNFTTGTLPGAFAKSSPSSGATGQSLTPTISWGASSGATSYEYCYDTTNDSACTNWISTGANTSGGLSGLTPGTTYYWQSRANNGAGTAYANGATTVFWSFTTIALPGAFGHASPGHGSTGQSLNPILSWGSSAGAANYDYCYDTTNDNACANWLGAGASTSVGLSGLTAATTYFWHVRAVNGGGTTYADGAATAFWSFTTGSLPGAFAKADPANGATGQSLTPSIDWAASSGATSYEYCYDTTNDNACSNWTSTGAASNASLSGLSPGTTYYWQSRANNGAGSTYANGSATSFWSFTTIALPGAFNHSAPANGATAQSLSPTLSWTASSGVANYDYCYDTTNDNACSSWVGAGASTSVGLSGLTAGVTYYWQVRAVNGGGTTYANGALTAFWSFSTGTLPGAFAKTSPANGATGQSLTPSLDWGTSTGATGYEYCYDTTNDNACSNWTSAGAASSGELSGLSPGTTYYWQARANNGAGTVYANGAATSFWSFTTIALPGAFAHSSPADGATGVSVTPTLSWTASAGVANYDYCYDTTNDNACTNWIGAGNSTSVPLTGLASNTTYYWQVRAVNGGGTTYANGAVTAFWDFKTRIKSTIVDLNGDGKGDAFTYNPSTGAWARQVSNGNGGFTTTTGSWNPGWTVVPATFNTDALTDFFLFNLQSGQWFKMLNSGTGFTTQSTGSWWQGWERYVMDLDGDGISDLFLYDRSSGQWFKAISTANGFNYLQGGWAPNWEIYPITLNADARADMFLIDRQTGRWFWVLGETGEGFSYPASETWFSGWQLYPGDFNGDGLSDMLLHDSSTGTFFVATNTGSGFTYQQGGWSLGWTPNAADINGDGKDDLFLHDQSTGAWYEMISNGAGGFTNGGGQTWSLGWQLHFSDLNGDGRADLVLYAPASGAWYQARNLTLGSFSYTNGQWDSGLIVITRPPIR